MHRVRAPRTLYSRSLPCMSCRSHHCRHDPVLPSNYTLSSTTLSRSPPDSQKDYTRGLTRLNRSLVNRLIHSGNTSEPSHHRHCPHFALYSRCVCQEHGKGTREGMEQLGLQLYSLKFRILRNMSITNHHAASLVSVYECLLSMLIEALSHFKFTRYKWSHLA